MRHCIIIATLLLVPGLLGEAGVSAQARLEVETATPAEGGHSAATASPLLVTGPDAAPVFSFSDLKRLQDVADRSRTSRNWLIASASATGISWIVFSAAISQCETINGVELCPRAADIAGTAGAVLLSFSVAGTLVSGIMLGVRNGQKEDILRSIQRRNEADVSESPAPTTPSSSAIDRFMITIPPDTALSITSFEKYQLRDAYDRRRFARNGLIGNAAVFGFSWIFLGAAISRCEWVSNDLRCTNAGEANLSIGIGLAAASATGMLVSSILLGVRSGQKKKLERSIRQRHRAGLRWDPQSGSFVF
ncbi:MAG: hypothetical protein JRF54_03650 [Deltaproteobacteria bacterium]|nr:hypothetical protein [Deltaproteobacteria bacterium]